MRHKVKTVACLLLMITAVLVLSACRAGNQVPGSMAAYYRIYYLNSTMTALSSQEYGTDTVIGDQVIDELMEQFLTAPNDAENQVALSSNVNYLGYRQESNILYLYFDAGYSNRANMNPSREILCRAALTKTMTQIDGIDYISIYVGDQPLLNHEGQPVGIMSAGDFIESISDVNTFERSQLKLFFADESGQRLIVEEREVVHSINTSMERLIVDELIKGPQSEGRYATLPTDVKLLNVSVNENVCYINFDTSFMNNIPDVKEYIPIYSMVNSLCELSTVTRVQITVNGSSDVMFRDAMSLDTQFERNLEIGEENQS